LGSASEFLVACLAATLTCWVFYFALARQGAFLGLVLTISVLEATRDFALSPPVTFESAFYIGHTGTLFTLGSVEIHIEDLLTVIAGLAALIGILRFRGGNLLGFALAGLAALTLLGLLFFSASEGFTHSVNYWRKWMLAIAFFGWATTTPRPWRWSDLNWLVGAGMLSSLLALAEIRLHGLGSAVGLTVTNGEALNGRPLGPQAALVALLAAWALALTPGRINLWRVCGIGLLTATVIAAQVRSVWIAALLSLLVWWAARTLRSGRFTLPRLAWTAVIGVGSLAGLALLVGSSPILQRSLSDQSTYQWRIERWQASFATTRSGLEWLAGGAFGPTPASLVDRTNGLYAHSLYVWSVESVGLIGAGLMLALIALSCFRRSQLRQGSWPLVVGATALGYGFTYGLPGWMWLVLGSCVAWMATSKTTATEDAGDSAKPNLTAVKRSQTLQT
jgi:hypothetical protein